jgi:hypothetical protein
VLGLSKKIIASLRKSSHRLPKRWYRVANESFEIARGYASNLSSSSRQIRKRQNELLSENYQQDTKKLIIFLAPGIDLVNGGVMSVVSLFEETRRLKKIHQSESILCSYPSDPALLNYSRFKNDCLLYDFSSVLNYFGNLESLIIHVPEHYIYRFNLFISKNNCVRLNKIKYVQINILIQNWDFLPSNRYIQPLKKLGRLTATTAHSKYSTLELRNRLGFPLHKLSVYVSSEQYVRKSYTQKANLMIVSPDDHPRKKEILHLIMTELPDLHVKIIQGMTYDQYKQTISSAKWALTFGEGLDGYFVEPVFSGAISFSVYRKEYFTKEFQPLRTVYPSYDLLKEKICADIRELDNPAEYQPYQQKQYQLCAKEYNHANYIKNLELFYEGKYTYP